MSKFDMTILPINDDQDDYKLKRELSPNIPDVRKGSLTIIVGSVRSGKTVYMNSLIFNPNFYYGIFDNIHYISPSVMNDDSCKYIRQACNCHEHYDDSIIENIERFQSSFPNKNKRPSCMIVADDIINEVGMNSRMFGLCTRYRHLSRCIMVVIMTQKFRKISPVCRANASDYVLMSGIYNKKEQEAIADEIADYFRMTPKEFIAFYMKHTKEPYSFLYIQMRTGLIFKNHDNVIYDRANRVNNDTDDSDSEYDV